MKQHPFMGQNVTRDFDAEIRRIERLRVTSLWVSRAVLLLACIGGYVVLRWTWFTLQHIIRFVVWCKDPVTATLCILGLVVVFGGLSVGTWMVYRAK